MKKISKCFLIVVSLVSLSFLVFYKSQYDKLYNVLQVLEFFGNREGIDSSADPFKRTNCPTSGSVGSAVFRPPSWQRLSGPSEVLIFSSFCSKNFDSNAKCPIVKVVALAQKNFDRNSVTCQLWYEDTLRPVLAMFSAEMLKVEEKTNPELQDEQIGSKNTQTEPTDSNLVPFLFSCESKFSALQPYGVSISAVGSKSESFSHVEPTTHESETPGREPEISVAACIRPQMSRTDSSRQILENVLLHRTFGVTDFYVYDAGLTTNFIETLNKIADLSISLKILPWNLPSGMIEERAMRVLVQTDCFLRTSGLSSSTISIDPQQILVPTSGSIVDALKQPKIEGKLELEVKKFCSEFESEPGSKLTVLQQTLFSKKLSSMSPKFVMAFKLGPKSDVVQVPRSLMSLHDYGHCSLEELSPDPNDLIRDPTMKKMAKIVESKIGRYFDTKIPT